jgi:hypothetical protein
MLLAWLSLTWISAGWFELVVRWAGHDKFCQIWRNPSLQQKVIPTLPCPFLLCLNHVFADGKKKKQSESIHHPSMHSILILSIFLPSRMD